MLVLLQIICGLNCTFAIQANGTVMACGEGSYGRLGQGNSEDTHILTPIAGLQGIVLQHSFPVSVYCSKKKRNASLTVHSANFIMVILALAVW